MALVLLSRDRILADYLLADCPALGRVIASPSEADPADALVVDADTCPPPFPAHTLLLISREEISADLPILLRPIAPGALEKALDPGERAYRMKDGAGILLTEKSALSLPPSEHRLLKALLDADGRMLSRKELGALLGDEDERDTDGLLTVYMYRLRKKLAPLGFTLRTHHKQGYSIHTGGDASC